MSLLTWCWAILLARRSHFHVSSKLASLDPAQEKSISYSPKIQSLAHTIRRDISTARIEGQMHKSTITVGVSNQLEMLFSPTCGHSSMMGRVSFFMILFKEERESWADVTMYDINIHLHTITQRGPIKSPWGLMDWGFVVFISNNWDGS